MKTAISNLFALPALIAGLGLIPAGPVTAQTFTTLHSFAGGSDGANPSVGLVLSGNTLYGTAQEGDTSLGAVFDLNIDGTHFETLHNFISTDGYDPRAGLILSSNTLYGTAYGGGSWQWGSVFKVNTDATGFTTLYSFDGDLDGAGPTGLILSSNTLYGTVEASVFAGFDGTVFKVNTDGTGFTTMHRFDRVSDGAAPTGLILSGNRLYGTANYGGSSNNGTVFAINTDGTGFTVLYNFTGGDDGDHPVGGLILSSNLLYGATSGGGSMSNGTLFAVHTDGTGFTDMHSFAGDRDGASPQAPLILSGNTLYGTTWSGGSLGEGTVFKVNTDGTGFTSLHSFTPLSVPYTGTTATELIRRPH